MKNAIKLLSFGLLLSFLFACQEEKKPKDSLDLSGMEISLELNNLGESMHEVILIKDLKAEKIEKSTKIKDFELELNELKKELSADNTDYSLAEVDNQLRVSEIKIERKGKLVYHFKEPKVLVFPEELK